MRKIVFYGVQYSGRSSTLNAMQKISNVEILDELWVEEEARIKKIIMTDKSVEIIACFVPYREEAARKKLFEGATEVYYFIPFPSNTDLGEEEFERQIYAFPEMMRRAEELNKDIKNVPWKIIFSKCDRVPNNPYLDILPKEYLKDYLCVSAHTGEGIEKLWQTIVSQN